MEDLAPLARCLAPRSVAVVGASDQLPMSRNAVRPMLEAGRLVHLVNPTRDRVHGQATVPSLAAIGEPVDAVLALVNAAASVAVVEEAGALGCGGVVVAAAGFAEAGPEGLALQERLAAAARDARIAVIGPNCSGFKHVPLGVNLFTGGPLQLPPGGVSVVSQSGFLTRAVLAGAGDRRLGVAIGVSSGNEAVCDLADYLDVLADDPHTRVVCLVVETIRRPEAFFAAAQRARDAGKPVLALKLGRGARAQRIVASHTGALAGEHWAYQVAFAEHGIVSARDVDELLDAAQLLGQLPPERFRAVERIGVVTTSGGVAALAADIAEDEGAPVPPLADLEAWVRERVPGDTVNPLDLTGFVMTDRERTEELLMRYADAVDVLVLCWWLGDQDEDWSRTLLEPFAAVAARTDTPCVVTPIEATSVGAWVDAWRDRGLVFARGARSAYRAAQAMHRFVTAHPRTLGRIEPDPDATPPPLVDSDAGPIVPFATAMDLLARAGVPVAPFALADPGAAPSAFAHLGPRLVVKLADVAHRTELGAVCSDVAPADVPAAVARLVELARGRGLPDAVVVQPMVDGYAEAFLGLQAAGPLGPMVLLGGGGVLVEVLGGPVGRRAPLDRDAARALVDEALGRAAALRGQRPWPSEALVDAVLGLDALWRQHGAWLDSVDVNPLIVSDDEVVAVDALLVARRNGGQP